MTIDSDRITLRRELRARRRALTAHQQHRAAQKVARRLRQHPWLRNAQNIAVYLPNDGEVSLRPLIQALWQQNKRVYLPVVLARAPGRMNFVRYRRNSLLRHNRFGIPEPRATEVCFPYSLDTVLMPLVGFDHYGSRLGMGGGFYDRTFARRARRPRLIGIAHRCQQVARLPNAPWDVPLDAVVTDQAWIYPRRPHLTP